MVRRNFGVAFLAGAVLILGCGDTADDVVPAAADDAAPQRIVSLAPSLTETLFALGLGDRVVGVTRFCAYPPEVLELPRVGGHLDPNFEAIVSLEPDLVVAIPSSRESGLRLESLGISVLEVDQKGKDAMEKIPKPKGPIIWATSNSPGFGNVPGLPSNAENPALK